jgi:hypothetical protein
MAMAIAFPPIEVADIPEPEHLGDILVPDRDTKEFNDLLTVLAALVDGLRAQTWPVVLTPLEDVPVDDEESDEESDDDDTEPTAEDQPADEEDERGDEEDAPARVEPEEIATDPAPYYGS